MFRKIWSCLTSDDLLPSDRDEENDEVVVGLVVVVVVVTGDDVVIGGEVLAYWPGIE